MNTTIQGTPAVGGASGVPTVSVDSAGRAGNPVHDAVRAGDYVQQRFNLVVNHDGTVTLVRGATTRSSVFTFRKLERIDDRAKTICVNGTLIFVSDVLLDLKNTRTTDRLFQVLNARYIHPDQRDRLLVSCARVLGLDVSAMASLDHWTDIHIMEVCGHQFVETVHTEYVPSVVHRARQPVYIPRSPLERVSEYPSRLEAMFGPQHSVHDTFRRSQSDDLSALFDGSLSPHFMSSIAQAAKRVVRAAAHTVGEGIVEGAAAAAEERQTSFEDVAAGVARAAASSAAEATVETTTSAVSAKMMKVVEGFKEAVVAAFAMVKKTILSLLGTVRQGLERLGTAIVQTCKAVTLWAVGKLSGVNTMVVNAVSRLFGYDFSEVDAAVGGDEELQEMHRQGGASFWSSVPSAAAKGLLLTVLGVILPKAWSSTSHWRSIVDVLAKTAPFTSGAASMIEWILETVQWCVNLLLRLCDKDEVRWFQSRNRDVAMWIAASYDYIKANEPPPPDEFMRHYAEGADLAKTAVGSIHEAQIKSMLQTLSNKFVTANNAAAYAKASRPEPVALTLQGSPGIGKSLLVNHLHATITCLTQPDIARKFKEHVESGDIFDFGQYIFYHNDSDYWNGYDQYRHVTLALDDAGKAKPGANPTQKSDSEILMAMINSAPWNLDFADVESKGNVYFRSPLVLITTNLDPAQWYSYASQTLTTPDAIMRRLQIFVSVSVAKGWEHLFPDGKLDVAAFNALTFVQRDQVYVYRGTHKTERINFTSTQQLCAYVAKCMLTTQSNFAATKLRANDDAYKALLNLTDESGNFCFDKVEPPVTSPLSQDPLGATVLEGFASHMAGTDVEEIKPQSAPRAPPRVPPGPRNDEQAWKWYMRDVARWEEEFPEAAKSAGEAGLNVKPRSYAEFVAMRSVHAMLDDLPDDAETVGVLVDGSGVGLALALIQIVATFAFQFVGGFIMARVVALALTALWNTLRAVVSAVKSFFFRKASTTLYKESGEHEGVLNAVVRNMYVLCTRAVECQPETRGSILFIKGQYALMPYHYLVDLWRIQPLEEPNKTVVTMKSMADGRWADIEWSVFNPEGPHVMQLLGHDNRPIDLAIVRIGGREHRDLTGLLRENGSSRPIAGHMAAISEERTPVLIPDISGISWVQGIMYEPREGYYLDHALRYNIQSLPGFCGSILVSDGSNGRTQILSMHVAGDKNGGGAGAAFTCQQVERAISAMSVKTVRVVKLMSHNDNGATLEKHSGTRLDERAFAVSKFKNGVPDPKHGDPPPSMVQSALHGWADPVFRSEKKPVVCTEAATAVEMEKYAYDAMFDLQDPLGSAAFVAADFALCDHGFDKVISSSRILSNEEAWFGLVNSERVANAVDGTTSTGYPFQNVGIVKSKIATDGVMKVQDAATIEVFDMADELLEALMNGDADVLETVIFKVSPKRELRPPNKGPRVIQCAPIHLVLVWRRLFWEFMDHYSVWRPENELGIGLDPRVHWDDLVKWLTAIHPPDRPGHVGAGDYSQFDQCQEPVISRAIGEAVIARYGPPSRLNQARRLLWTTACGPRVIFKNIQYALAKGMPSGHPATSIINGLYNCTLFRLCYGSMHLGGTVDDPIPGGPGQFMAHLRRFRERVHLTVTGDDNTFSSTDSEFNEMALPALMARFGARYTLDTKQGAAATPFRHITEVSYLGRAFRQEALLGGKWVGPLRLESVALMGQYAEKENQLCPQWYEDVGKAIVEELAFHPQEVWDQWMPHVVENFIAKGHLWDVGYVPGDEGVRVAIQEGLSRPVEDMSGFSAA